MKNQFIAAVEAADKAKWCTRRWCTTCGHRDFVQELQRINGSDQSTLYGELAAIDLTELVNSPNWDECICSIFERRFSPSGTDVLSQSEKVSLLRNWLEKASEPVSHTIRFADVIIYYIIKAMPKDEPIVLEWIKQGFFWAQACQDPSLVESLLYLLRGNLDKFPELLQLGNQMSKSSEKVAVALRKTV